MFYTSKYVTEAVCHSVVGVLLIFALSLAGDNVPVDAESLAVIAQKNP
jgi:hypothetical protein